MKKKDNWVSFVAFSCVHAPLHDEDAIAWLIEQIKEVKPTFVIHLGDGFEGQASSRWPEENGISLLEEYEQHDKILERIRKASPDSNRIFLEGNHDHNIRAKGRLDKRLRGLTDYNVPQYNDKNQCVNKELMTEWRFGAEYIYCRRRGSFRIGQVVFAHGYECGIKSGENEAVYFSGGEYNLYVRGHTHRPQPVTRVMKTGRVPLRYWYANAGCMRDMEDVEYMRRNKRELWGQGCVVGQCKPLNSPRRERNWEAETRIYRMFDDPEK
jgi:UDP-2,3-diacylglucosamine pyrophosphatase LpxH